MRARSTKSSSRVRRPRRSTSSLGPSGRDIGAGDEIVLSIMEHHSNIVPWHFHRERKGAVLNWVDASPRTAISLSLDELRARSSPRTKIVAITHMSNVLGTVLRRSRRSSRIAHARGAPVLVDASRRAPCISTSTCSAISTRISTSSPATRSTARPASACSMASAKWLEKLPPYQGGGEMIETVTLDDRITYNSRRRTASRPGRRRSCRLLGLARRLTICRRSAASGDPRA